MKKPVTDKCCTISLTSGVKTVKFTEARSGARGWGRGSGVMLVQGCKFQLRETDKCCSPYAEQATASTALTECLQFAERLELRSLVHTP